MIRVLPFLIYLVVFLLGCKNSLDDLLTDSNKPTISSMTPSQANRGQQNVDGTIVGSNFKGLVTVDLGSGIQILQIVVNNPTLISVRFNVTADAAGGTRIIKVTTLAGVGESSNAFSVKDTRAPSASFSVDPSNGGKTTVFRFDASASSDPDGRIESYSWDFGDGRTGSGKVVEHQYNSAGNFNVTLTVTDNENSQSSSSKNIEVKNTIPPIARYTVAPNIGSVDTVFRFDGSNSQDRDGRIVRYEWDFKDGTILDGRVVHHKFERSDDFNVKLTVFDNEGLESFVEKEILVRGVPPVARIQVTPGSGDTSTTFRFDGTVSEDPDGDIVSFDWRFAGGTQFATPTFDRRFPENGTYSVTLTVRDDDGMEDSTTEELAVGGGGSGDDDDDGGAGRCTTPSRQRTPYFFRVISADAGSKVIVGEFFEDVECSDVFYLCGDVRLGGIRPGDKEYWMGTICEMSDLGNNRFEIHLVNGTDWPDIGETGTYVWPQLDCNPAVTCR